MEIINRYFGKIIFFKADLREEHSVYVAALSSSFQDGKKQYALAFVPVHLAIISQGYLSDLSWVNLQTRTMINGYRIKPQRWEIPKNLDNPMFTATDRSETKTKYRADQFPLEMVLIHDPRKKSSYQYHTHMNLLAALTTFKCVISLVDTRTPVLQQLPGRTVYPSSPGNSTFPISVGSTPVAGTRPNREGIPPQTQRTEMVPRQTSVRMNAPIGFRSEDAGILPSPEITGAYVSPSRERDAEGGRYTTIGLPEYTVPHIPPANSKRRETRPEMIAQPRGTEVIDDSFEFL